MTERIDPEIIHDLQPAIRQALRALAAAAAGSGLEPLLIELVKLRASQINGCAFCLNMHNVEACARGEDQLRLDLVSAWREAPCFSARERAALAWTEALTLLPQSRVTDEIYASAMAQFSAAELVNLTAAVVAINGWNRVAVAFRFVPPVAAG